MVVELLLENTPHILIQEAVQVSLVIISAKVKHEVGYAIIKLLFSLDSVKDLVYICLLW